MCAALAVVGVEDGRRPRRVCGGHPLDRPWVEAGTVPEHDDRGRHPGRQGVQPGPQRERLPLGPAVAADRPHPLQVDAGEHLVGVRAQHQHPVVRRDRGDRRQHVLEHRPAADRMQLLGGAEAAAGTGRQHHQADHVVCRSAIATCSSRMVPRV